MIALRPAFNVSDQNGMNKINNGDLACFYIAMIPFYFFNQFFTTCIINIFIFNVAFTLKKLFYLKLHVYVSNEIYMKTIIILTLIDE